MDSAQPRLYHEAEKIWHLNEVHQRFLDTPSLAPQTMAEIKKAFGDESEKVQFIAMVISKDVYTLFPDMIDQATASDVANIMENKSFSEEVRNLAIFSQAIFAIDRPKLASQANIIPRLMNIFCEDTVGTVRYTAGEIIFAIITKHPSLADDITVSKLKEIILIKADQDAVHTAKKIITFLDQKPATGPTLHRPAQHLAKVIEGPWQKALN